MRSRGAGFLAGDGGNPTWTPLVNPKESARRGPSMGVVCAVAVLFVMGIVTFGTSVMSVLLHVPLTASSSVQVSVRVNTFRRNDLLLKFMAHYGACHCVREIVVVWSDQLNEPPHWLAAMKKAFIERHSRDSLNNRFVALRQPPTEAVLSADDDVFVSCRDLAAMVDAWSASPRQMLGPAPRLIAKAEDGAYRYLRWWHVWWNGHYSLVLTKLAVFHRDYLDAYADNTNRIMTDVRKYVDEHRNCEDIAMSFLVANATRAPPSWFRARYRDYGQSFASHSGISASQDHIQIRQDCLRTFAAKFGRDPLTTTSHKVSDATVAWLW